MIQEIPDTSAWISATWRFSSVCRCLLTHVINTLPWGLDLHVLHCDSDSWSAGRLNRFWFLTLTGH